MYVATLGNAGQATDLTVSEAMGYGLLISVLMANYDTSAQETFNSLLAFVESHQVASGLPFMSWRVASSCQSGTGALSATDAEFDIAFALLLADFRWGSAEASPYASLAQKRIEALMAHNIQNANSPAPIVGLWEDIQPNANYWGGSRPSDLMPTHLRAFAEFSGDSRWTAVLNTYAQTIPILQSSSSYALLPDFTVSSGLPSSVRAASPNYLERFSDGDYAYNACRIPMRLAGEIVQNPTSPFRPFLEHLVGGLVSLSGGQASQMTDGYALNGATIGKNKNVGVFVGPVAAALKALEEDGAANDPATQSFLQATLSPPNNEVYYSATVRLLSRILLGI